MAIGLRLLLDTHALIWWLAGDEALSRPAREAIADEANNVAVSAASAMEVATKFRIGRLPDAALLAQDFEAIVADQGFAELAVTAAENGFVTGIATRDIGLAVVALGGGRTRPGDGIDHAVGITRLLPVGASVAAGDPLALVHARSRAAAERAAATIRAAYAIGAAKPPPRKPVIRRVAPAG